MSGAQLLEDPAPIVTDRTLRQFAGLCVVFFGTLFALSWYRNQGSPRTSAWVGLVFGLVVGLPGLFRAGWIRPVFLTATALTRPIGHTTGKIFLALIYFGLITPLGRLFRLFGRDLLGRDSTESQSYWIPISEPQDVRRYLHQYQKERSLSPASSTGVDHGIVQSANR
jgi:hypothetical protein